MNKVYVTRLWCAALHLDLKVCPRGGKIESALSLLLYHMLMLLIINFVFCGTEVWSEQEWCEENCYKKGVVHWRILNFYIFLRLLLG